MYFSKLSTTAMATRARPQLSKHPLDNGQFFQRLMKKSKMVMKSVDPYDSLMIQPGNRILIVRH